MHPVRLGRPELPFEDESGHNVAKQEPLRQALQLQCEVGPVLGLSFDEAKYKLRKYDEGSPPSTRQQGLEASNPTSQRPYEIDPPK